MQDELETQILDIIWLCFTTGLKVVGFLAFKMLSVMFVSTLRKWYLDRFYKEKKATEERPVADEFVGRKQSCKGRRKVGKSGEESFVLNVNHILDTIKLRKEQRDKHLVKVKANLEESMKKMDSKE